MRKGGAFRLVGLILGIVGTAISITSIVFAAIGLIMGRRLVQPNVRRS